ncbi:MAG TPA: GTPase Era [Candidatus Methanoperedens sp.]|nr:GTPase Era [Candidatus Methanoperedens sp.]
MAPAARRAAGRSGPSASAAPRRSGVVACLGRTNVGKSTLLNRLLGQKLAIVSPKPQTTSRRLRGIVNTPGGQAVIVDTPGLHAADRAINRSLLRETRAALGGADAILAVTDLDASRHPPEETLLRDLVRESRLPAVLALNKTDLLDTQAVRRFAETAREAGGWADVVAISARTGRNVDQLLRSLIAALPVGEPLHPADILSDQPEREFFAEMIREQIFRTLHQELPYSAAVVIEDVAEDMAPRHRYRIRATIYIERDSQKGIIIGEGGSGLRRIGAGARRAIEELTGAPVYLGLWVKVRRNWTKDERSLREFGFERG